MGSYQTGLLAITEQLCNLRNWYFTDGAAVGTASMEWDDLCEQADHALKRHKEAWHREIVNRFPCQHTRFALADDCATHDKTLVIHAVSDSPERVRAYLTLSSTSSRSAAPTCLYPFSE